MKIVPIVLVSNSGSHHRPNGSTIQPQPWLKSRSAVDDAPPPRGDWRAFIAIRSRIQKPSHFQGIAMRKAGPLRADSARGLQETSVDTHGVTGLSDRYHQRVERVDAFATLTRAGGVIMKPSVAIAAHSDAIRRIVESNRAQDPRVFASVLHGGDHEESEIDILVGPTAETRHFDIRAIVDELKELLGVPVHLATPNALPAKTRDQIVAEAQPI